jgi:hypothetical protein
MVRLEKKESDLERGRENWFFPCRKVMKTVGFHGEPEIASQSASRVRIRTTGTIQQVHGYSHKKRIT